MSVTDCIGISPEEYKKMEESYDASTDKANWRGTPLYDKDGVPSDVRYANDRFENWSLPLKSWVPVHAFAAAQLTNPQSFVGHLMMAGVDPSNALCIHRELASRGYEPDNLAFIRDPDSGHAFAFILDGAIVSIPGQAITVERLRSALGAVGALCEAGGGIA